MTKLNLEIVDDSKLVDMLRTADAALIGQIRDELTRRLAERDKPQTGHTVSWNASGGVFVRHSDKCAMSDRTGNKYQPSANLPVEIAKLLVESAEVREMIANLLNQSVAERDAVIAEKTAKKEKRNLKALREERRSIVLLIGKGTLPKSALEEFDSEHGSLDS